MVRARCPSFDKVQERPLRVPRDTNAKRYNIGFMIDVRFYKVGAWHGRRGRRRGRGEVSTILPAAFI